MKISFEGSLSWINSSNEMVAFVKSKKTLRFGGIADMIKGGSSSLGPPAGVPGRAQRARNSPEKRKSTAKTAVSPLIFKCTFFYKDRKVKHSIGRAAHFS